MKIDLNEIFLSLQGEGGTTGNPCIFIRLAGCNLKCTYCDTRYSLKKKLQMSVTDIIERIKPFEPVREIMITGGEPLIQKSAVKELCGDLIKKGYHVILETNGSISLSGLQGETVFSMDLKPPSTGESHQNLYSNLKLLRKKDELKFILADKKDYEWAKKVMLDNKIHTDKIFFSAVTGHLPLKKLGEWILKDRLPVRLMVRLHKLIGIK